jgi:hypothetical protein
MSSLNRSFRFRHILGGTRTCSGHCLIVLSKTASSHAPRFCVVLSHSRKRTNVWVASSSHRGYAQTKPQLTGRFPAPRAARRQSADIHCTAAPPWYGIARRTGVCENTQPLSWMTKRYNNTNKYCELLLLLLDSFARNASITVCFNTYETPWTSPSGRLSQGYSLSLSIYIYTYIHI